jgi:uncharacterized protein
MKSSEIAEQMILYSQGNLHDISHFLKVFAYAKIIGECENLSSREQQTVEIAALVHDIACPLCREKYGNTDGKHQEKEGVILARDFLSDKSLPDDVLNRVVFLVGHHHTYSEVDGPDYQILLEADYLVNADESQFSRDNIRSAKEKIFKTKTGISLLQSLYGDL